MKSILCFGDSNTWGYNPRTKERYSRNERWTGVLRQELGDGYEITEEGLNGRTTVWEDPIEGHKSGKEYLIPCLESHQPIDLVTIMLGTNDLKKRFSLFLSAFDIANSAGVLADIALRSGSGPGGGAPKVLLMAPPKVGKLTEFAEMFEDAEVKSRKFSQHYRQIANDHGCEFLDTSQIVTSSDIDGIHLELSEHQKLGKAVAALVKKILG